jgi:hypothetical protein
LIAFVAEQIDALPVSIEEYLAAERNRQRHAVEARREIKRRLTAGLSADQRRRPDVLTDRRAESRQSWLI